MRGRDSLGSRCCGTPWCRSRPPCAGRGSGLSPPEMLRLVIVELLLSLGVVCLPLRPRVVAKPDFPPHGDLPRCRGRWGGSLSGRLSGGCFGSRWSPCFPISAKHCSNSISASRLCCSSRLGSSFSLSWRYYWTGAVYSPAPTQNLQPHWVQGHKGDAA